MTAKNGKIFFKNRNYFVAVVRRPEPFVIGKTKPSFVALEGGWRRYDLRPHMRVDLEPAIKKRGNFNYLFPQKDPAVKVADVQRWNEEEDYDFPMQKILRKACNFEHRDYKGNSVVRNDRDREAFRKRLEFGWYDPFISVDLTIGKYASGRLIDVLRLDSAADHGFNANLFMPSEKLTNCNFDLEIMEIISENTLDYFLRISGLNTLIYPEHDGIVKWDGDLKENDFWGLFKYNNQSGSGQIDDRKDPVRNLIVNPDGYLALTYKKPGRLTFERMKNAAYIISIALNSPFLELKE